MSEVSPVRITDIFPDAQLIGPEPTEPGFNYEVTTFRLEDKTRDVAEVRIKPNGFIPPELIQRGRITDRPIRGRGTFIILTPGEGLRRIEFDSNKPTPESSEITYGNGAYIGWRAYDEGLDIIEVCSPPVEDAVKEFQVLDIEDPTIPEEFRVAYKDLTSPKPQV